MIIHKLTLMIAAILGLLAQVSMAQSSATMTASTMTTSTMTTSTVPAMQTGLAVGSDNDVSVVFDDEWYNEDFDEYLDEDFEDFEDFDEDDTLDEDEDYDLDDPDMGILIKKDGRPGHRRKKPHGYRGWKGRCNPGFLCQAKYYGQACRCTKLKESCSCNEPVFHR